MARPASSKTSPLSLLQAARSFQDAAAGMLNETGNLNFVHQMQAYYLLTGFGIEVALKSHLRHLGLNDFPDLHAISHDLVAAARAVSERIAWEGDLPPNLFEIVRRLGPVHKELIMRYTPDETDILLPHPSAVMEVLAQLVDSMALRLLCDGLYEEGPATPKDGGPDSGT